MTRALTLQRTQHVLEQGIAQHLHTGAQLCVYHAGERIIDTALGNARADEPMSPTHLLRWMSAGKPITAVAIAQLYEAGELNLDDPVARFIPTFAQAGKDEITIDHLLTHTVSFPDDVVRFDVQWDQVIAELCAAPLQAGWQPGRMAAYQPLGTWFVLGQIIQTIAQRPLSEHLRQRIFEPAGMHESWLGIPESQYHAYADRIAPLHDTRGGQIGPAIRYTAEQIIPPNPGSNATGPIRELARFYQMLLNEGEIDQNTLLQPATVRTFTARQRIGLYDHTMQHTMDWARGFAVNSNRYGAKTVPYSFGPYAGEQAFGHGGMQSSMAFADPVHELAVAYVCNGLPGEPANHKRNNAILKALYEDLGLTD